MMWQSKQRARAREKEREKRGIKLPIETKKTVQINNKLRSHLVKIIERKTKPPDFDVIERKMP